ncbi:hypothetical protein [Bacillus sp. T33-2]|uniref:hypothetical protein n=1 Tax=Bacillus sp. T33-2 TaxID=2054168 RepID=UPI000C76EB4D|nr:hypothetical protein [Bacillus sp. T33-2]PLR91937.1 hypothetical protein CVD19_21345 [Bacillus sp. T33-2]
MERIRPEIKNNLEIPVNIYKGEYLVAECPNIQSAARWLKEDTNQTRFNWSAINNGIWFDKPYSYNGVTYYFLTALEAVSRKQEEMKEEGKILMKDNTDLLEYRVLGGMVLSELMDGLDLDGMMEQAGDALGVDEDSFNIGEGFSVFFGGDEE